MWGWLDVTPGWLIGAVTTLAVVAVVTVVVGFVIAALEDREPSFKRPRQGGYRRRN